MVFDSFYFGNLCLYVCNRGLKVERADICMKLDSKFLAIQLLSFRKSVQGLYN